MSPQHPNCMTMEIPKDDEFYSQHGQTCMDFKRSVAGQRPSCALGKVTSILLLLFITT